MVVRPSIEDEKNLIRSKVLCFLHYQIAKSPEYIFQEEKIRDCISVRQTRLFSLTIELLIEEGLISRSNDTNENIIFPGLCIEDTGILEVEYWDDDQYQLISQGIDFLHEEIPAADRYVSLDHNSAEYREAVDSLDQVIVEFEKDNRLENDLGREKGALLQTLKAGRKLLDDTKLNVRIGVAMLLEPLKHIGEKYDQAIVGGVVSAAAAIAIAAFSKLLGIG